MIKPNDLTGLSAKSPVPSLERDREAWVVNTLKIRIIQKLDNCLEPMGRLNARKLFLAPVFSISGLCKRIEEQAPEMKTFFYKELFVIISSAKEVNDINSCGNKYR